MKGAPPEVDRGTGYLLGNDLALLLRLDMAMDKPYGDGGQEGFNDGTDHTVSDEREHDRHSFSAST